MQTVGVIGLGLLGSAIADRLQAGGCDVVGFDVRDDVLSSMREREVTPAASARDVVQSSECTVLCVPDSTVSLRVAGEVRGACGGKLILDATTGAPEDAIAIGKRLSDAGGRYVESTVIGSSTVVRAGEAVVLLAGAAEDCTSAAEAVHHFAQRSFVTGGPGSASRAKLVVNLVLGLNRAVLAEGLQLARRSGLDVSQMLDILRSGAAYSRVMDAKGRKMVDEEFAPEARLAQHHKDVRLILEMAAACGAATPLSLEHEKLLQRAEQLGFAESDNSAIYKAFET